MARLLVVVDPTPERGDTQRQAVCKAALRAGFHDEDLHCPDSWDAARAAVETPTGGPFHAAVIDIELWGRWEGGVDLIRDLHSRHPGCLIVAVTERRGDDALHRATAAGANDFLNAQTNLDWREDLQAQLTFYRTLL